MSKHKSLAKHRATAGPWTWSAIDLCILGHEYDEATDTTLKNRVVVARNVENIVDAKIIIDAFNLAKKLREIKDFAHKVANGSGGRPDRKLSVKASSQTVGGLRKEIRHIRDLAQSALEKLHK